MNRVATDLSHAPTTVVVVATGERSESTARALAAVEPGCITLDGDAALALIRSRPFSVRAMVVSGDGESRAIQALLAAVKEFAPRLPIVFLDERDSTTSELIVRRSGVHYYTHAPAATGEISAVLHGLTGGTPAQFPAVASHPVE